jgi:hypothetical protein
MPGSPELNLALSFFHSLPQPVLKKTPSPSMIWKPSMPSFFNASRTSAIEIS